MDTVIKNRFGHIHIFKNVRVSKLDNNNSNYKTIDGKESDIYLQDQSDIETFEDTLLNEDKNSLDNGYAIVTATEY